MAVQMPSSQTVASTGNSDASLLAAYLSAETSMQKQVEKTNAVLLASFQSSQEMLKTDAAEKKQLRAELLASETARKKESELAAAKEKAMQKQFEEQNKLIASLCARVTHIEATLAHQANLEAQAKNEIKRALGIHF